MALLLPRWCNTYLSKLQKGDKPNWKMYFSKLHKGISTNRKFVFTKINICSKCTTLFVQNNKNIKKTGFSNTNEWPSFPRGGEVCGQFTLCFIRGSGRLKVAKLLSPAATSKYSFSSSSSFFKVPWIIIHLAIFQCLLCYLKKNIICEGLL